MNENIFKREIFISPHPDDICFSAFLAVSQKEQNCKSVILDVFNRSCWTFTSEPGQENSEEVTKTRRSEELAFISHVKADVEFLEFEDSSLRYREFGHEYKQIPQEEPLYGLIEKRILNILERYNPISRIYVPLGISGHVDHLICRDIFFRQPDMRKHIIFYEDLPYIARFNENEIKAFVSNLDPKLVPSTLSISSSEPKKIAMNLYRSQLESHTISTVITYGLRLGQNYSFVERYWKFA